MAISDFNIEYVQNYITESDYIPHYSYTGNKYFKLILLKFSVIYIILSYIVTSIISYYINEDVLIYSFYMSLSFILLSTIYIAMIIILYCIGYKNMNLEIVKIQNYNIILCKSYNENHINKKEITGVIYYSDSQTPFYIGLTKGKKFIQGTFYNYNGTVIATI